MTESDGFFFTLNQILLDNIITNQTMKEKQRKGRQNVITFARFPSLTMSKHFEFQVSSTKPLTFLPRLFCCRGESDFNIFCAIPSSPNNTAIEKKETLSTFCLPRLS